jgi:hypothetical protein
MLNSKFILSFGLSDKQNFDVNSYLINTKCQLIKVNTSKEFILTNHCLAIINCNILNDMDIQTLNRYYSEIDGGLTDIILISNDKKGLLLIDNTQLFRDFEAFQFKLDVIIKKAIRTAKFSENIIKNMLYADTILNALKQHNEITIDQLSAIINRKEKVVRRYIEVLRIMGNDIEYDGNVLKWIYKN